MGLFGPKLNHKTIRNPNDRGGNRTHDQTIKSRLLYQLSYAVAYLAHNQQSYCGKETGTLRAPVEETHHTLIPK